MARHIKSGEQVIVTTGADKGKLSILWTARDKNLSTHPITLSYAEQTAGPWRPVGEKLANSVALTLFARVAMLIATGLILPAALWMGNRGVSTIDEISKKIDAMKEASIEDRGEIRALRAESSAQQKILTDHEIRVRELERAGRISQPLARP